MQKVSPKTELLIFDMDGVISSENSYIDSAKLCVAFFYFSEDFFALKPKIFYEFSSAQQIIESLDKNFLTLSNLQKIKASGLATNWDLAAFMIFLSIFDLLKKFADKNLSQIAQNFINNLHDLQKYDLRVQKQYFLASIELFEKLKSLFLQAKKHSISAGNLNFLIENFYKENYNNLPEFAVYDFLNEKAQQILLHPCQIFQRNGIFWRFLQDLFQFFYLGSDEKSDIAKHNQVDKERDEKNLRNDGKRPKNFPNLKGSCYNFKNLSPFFKQKFLGLKASEKLLFDDEILHNFLQELSRKYILGVATGRKFNEINYLLKKANIMQFFENERFITHDEIEHAQLELGVQTLSKPNPFIFLKAIFPQLSNFQILNKISKNDFDLQNSLIIGDSSEIGRAHV